jgi:hypothetical protein
MNEKIRILLIFMAELRAANAKGRNPLSSIWLLAQCWKYHKEQLSNESKVGKLLGPIRGGQRREHWACVKWTGEKVWRERTFREGLFSHFHALSLGRDVPFLSTTGRPKWPTDFWPIWKLFLMILPTLRCFSANSHRGVYPIDTVRCPLLQEQGS